MDDFRPTSLEGIVGQEVTVARLKGLANSVRKKIIVPPHLLMHGPPGVGKTTAARAFAREILGVEWENSFHQLSSSDDRGVLKIRDGLVPLSRLPPSRGAPFRVIFLDEADRLVPKAQVALQAALENESGSTVFILACNNLRLILKPIQSRCTILEFSALGNSEMKRVVSEALTRTSQTLSEEALESVVARADGVPREAVKALLEEIGTGPGWPDP